MSYSVEAANAPSIEGETKPHRNPLTRDTDLIKQFDDAVATLYDNFQIAVKKYGDRPYLGTRRIVNGEVGEYEFETYSQVAEHVSRLAAGMSSMSLPENSKIGIYSINRPEWIHMEQACYALNFVPVPLYDTLGDEAIVFICEQTEMEVIAVDLKKIPMLVKLRDQIPNVKKLIVMNEIIPEAIQKDLTDANIEFITFKELKLQGESIEFTPKPPRPEDLCTISYTSGTTGLPKGAMITHSAMVASGAGALYLVGENKKYPNTKVSYGFVRGEEVYLSYLPLAHILERIVFNTLMSLGFRFAFYQGDILKLMSDAEACRPTFFVGVPRLFNRIHDKVLAGVEAKGPVSKAVFNYALASKIENFHNSGQMDHWLWDWLVFNKIKEKLGGRVKIILTGSAPLSPQIFDFLRAVFGCKVMEGYGTTETCGVVASIICSFAPGPSPATEIKLVDVPEMGYTSKDDPHPRGEIWVRGHNIFTGYYKNENETEASLKDGWFNTGDIGQFDEQGRLTVIDRKKNIFKLSQGEYVAPEKIEALICRQAKIAQAYVEGDSLKSFLVAIIVPDAEVVLPLAKSMGIEGETLAEVCKDERLKNLILEDIKKLGSKGTKELKGFEIPKAIYLEPEMFSGENDLLTPTFKLKRNIARKLYAEKIEEMYASVTE